MFHTFLVGLIHLHERDYGLTVLDVIGSNGSVSPETHGTHRRLLDGYADLAVYELLTAAEEYKMTTLIVRFIRIDKDESSWMTYRIQGRYIVEKVATTRPMGVELDTIRMEPGIYGPPALTGTDFEVTQTGVASTEDKSGRGSEDYDEWMAYSTPGFILELVERVRFTSFRSVVFHTHRLK
ncbi:hypothetical protein M231_03003 [Tremella mesenterica]|uniref:Uncharacterized protein n=1 Tax=Tremella mesenterica TaxID=5217 RepID=A0A4Q1BP51_TREME|nr:hypothetical protein M231_03003 [Tremella mesenterica]